MKTTIDIENLKEVKKRAIDLDITLKEFINEAVEEKMKNINKKL